MALSDITVIYLGKYDIYCPSNYYHEQPVPHAADVNSKFKIVRDLKYAYYHNERLPLRPIVTSETYYIDDIVVDEKTWNDVFKTMSKRIQNVTGSKPKYFIVNDTDGTTTIQFITDVLRGKRATMTIFDDLDINEKRINECVKNFLNLKGDNNMKNLTITSYKYNPETKTTTIWWSDNSQTSVTADPNTEANEFTGFCAACAKKLFGNKSTYLNQFDKWTVKIPARQKAEAEKKAAEEKELAERRAKRAAKKEERRRQRLIDDITKSIVDDYNTADIIEAAEKRAVEKYGVPSDYIANRNNCECDCCKEQDEVVSI